MRHIIFSICLLLACFLGCKKAENQPENFISFKVMNDRAYNFANATWFPLNEKTWVVGDDPSDKTQIRLFLPKEISVGIYPIDSTQTASASFIPQGSSVYAADSGSVEVTLYDPAMNHLEGKFHFSASLFGPIGIRYVIEEGKFSAKF